ncbi:hypothetical protein EDC04DRAFT_2903249 [Pisolithus marmoratus]|nr:hypothetical protein EDC04DRAFT_2903249 [Pisolithus marmoratus]
MTNCALLGLIRQGRESPLHFLTKPASKPTLLSPPKPALLAPPEYTLLDQTQGNGVTPSKAPVVPVNSTKTSPLPANSTEAGNPAVINDELAKCKACAERFGILLAEPKQPPQRQVKKVSKQSGPVSDDPGKLKKLAECFGSTNTPSQSVESGSKGVSPVDEVDAEELER